MKMNDRIWDVGSDPDLVKMDDSRRRGINCRHGGHAKLAINIQQLITHNSSPNSSQ
jgi:hypothetical protein